MHTVQEPGAPMTDTGRDPYETPAPAAHRPEHDDAEEADPHIWRSVN